MAARCLLQLGVESQCAPTLLVLGLSQGWRQDEGAVQQHAQALAHGLGARGAVEAAEPRGGLHGPRQPQAPRRHLRRFRLCRLRLCIANPAVMITSRSTGASLLIALHPNSRQILSVTSRMTSSMHLCKGGHAMRLLHLLTRFQAR